MKRLLIFMVAAALLASMPVAAAPAYVQVYADPTPPASIVVDGRISTDEWGEPTAVFTYDEVAKEKKGWVCWKYFGTAEEARDQQLEFYTRRDAEHLYMAFRFVNTHHIDYGYTDKDGWRHAGMKVAFGAFDPETVLVNGEADGVPYEKWLSYTLRQKYDVDADVFHSVISAGGSIGEASYKKPNAAIWIDEDNYSYNYEIAVPYTDLYGVVTADTEELALSFEMTDARVAGIECGNRWFISEAVRMACESKDPQAFYNYNPLRVTYAEEPAPVPPEPSESTVTPEEPADEAPSSFPWIIPIIAAAVIVAAVAVVIVRKKALRKENQK